MRFTVGLLLVSVCLARDVRAQAPPDTSRKSRLLAGVLGYALPGTGSLYAGDGRHAVVHGSIALVTAAAIAISEVDQCNSTSCSRTKNGFGLALFLSLLTNAVWSSVTAVHDAEAHNERAAQRRGSGLGLSPASNVVSAGGAGGSPRMQLRMIQLSF